MDLAFNILVIVLGVLLLIFLALAVTAAIIAVSILKNLKHISQKAEETTTSFADIAAMVGKKVAPIALSTAVAAAMRRLKVKK